MRKAVKIVTFYDDGTFEESTPSLEPIKWNPPAPNPSMPYQPVTPVNPWTQPYPWYPPYTIWCKTADGTMEEIKITNPIVAQTNTNEKT
jgi:hypothetical protein